MSTPTNFHMSLAYVVLNNFELNSNFYECPANWSISEEDRPRRPLLGAYFAISGVILVVLYAFCFIALITSDRVRSPGYKIMITLAISDIPSLLVNSVSTGIMGFFGISFCDYPRLIYFLGCNAFGWWLGCSAACITLALCRISEVNMRLNISWIFKTSFMNVVMIFLIVVPVYGGFFNKPGIFHPEYMSWFFDPGLGFDPSFYVNVNQPINNGVSTVITLSLYAHLTYFMIQRGKNIQSEQFLKTQRQVILQAAIICLFHSMTSTLYVYMQFFYSPPWLIVVAQLAWQMSTGSASIIYLTLNKTIRSSVFSLIFPVNWNPDNRVSFVLDSGN